MRPSIWPEAGWPVPMASRRDVWTLVSNEGPLFPVEAGFDTCLGVGAFFSVSFLFITRLAVGFLGGSRCARSRQPRFPAYPLSVLCLVRRLSSGQMGQPTHCRACAWVCLDLPATLLAGNARRTSTRSVPRDLPKAAARYGLPLAHTK